MMRLRVAASAFLLSLALGPSAAPEETTSLAVGVPLGTSPRYGVNLGGRTVWGAEQLMANVLRNPGLEGVHDGALIVVGQVDLLGVVDDQPWTARPDGFWTGARFEVLTGVAVGARGGISADRRTGPELPVAFALDPMPAGLTPGDVIAIEGRQDPAPAPAWWNEGDIRVDDADARPGSPGLRSLHLVARPGRTAALHHHLDGITARAGKLLPVRGLWTLTLWLRAREPGTRVRLRFVRHGAQPFLDQTLEPSTDWGRYAFEFVARDDGPVGPLQFTLEAESGTVQADDLSLGPAAAGPGGFRVEVLEALRELRPGYVRDWQGQLADTPANRTASPWARGPIRYRPGEAEIQYAYSIGELGSLAAAVGARPWITLPATSTPAQARRIGAALRRLWLRHGFDEIVVEHGNEHWNAIFRPAGIADPARLAQAADRAFAALRVGAGPEVPLHRVLGAPPPGAFPPEITLALARSTREIEAIAVAPYLLYRLESGMPPAEALQEALHESDEDLRSTAAALGATGRALDVYEVNLHTTEGSAGPAERDRVVTAPAAGVALARRLLQGTLAGVQRQAVYALAGYDTFAHDRQLVQLFGIARDLAGPGTHWRSTGQALALLNESAGGRAWAVACAGPHCGDLVAVAWGLAAAPRWTGVNASPRAATLQWACAAPQRLRWLEGISATDPERATVGTARVPCRAGQARFTVPGVSIWAAQPSS